jgi:hypothetical protein
MCGCRVMQTFAQYVWCRGKQAGQQQKTRCRGKQAGQQQNMHIVGLDSAQVARPHYLHQCAE